MLDQDTPIIPKRFLFLLLIITYLNPVKNLSSTNKIANFANYHKKGVFYVRKQTYFDQRSAG